MAETTPTRFCPSADALHNAFSEHRGSELPKHVADCETCRAQWKALESLAERVAASHVPRDGAVSVDTDALVEAAGRLADRRARRRRHLFAASAAAAACVISAIAWATLGRGPGSVAPTHEPAVTSASQPAPETENSEAPAPIARDGEVRAIGDANFVVGGTPANELIRLHHGAVLVDVAPQASGERFRVVTGDAEVEVRGTSFEVRAVDDALTSVRVFEGVVDVRRDGEPLRTLRAGERWDATAARASATPSASAPVDQTTDVPTVRVETARAAPEPPPRPNSVPPAAQKEPPNRDPSRNAPPTGSSDGGQLAPAGTASEAAFNRGWLALRDGDQAAAVHAFDSLVQTDPTGEFADDARFWRAVGLQRADESDDAIDAYAEYLRHAPTGRRADEAHLARGWLLLDAERTAEAQTAFAAALRAADPRVRAAASEGLDTLQTRSADEPLPR